MPVSKAVSPIPAKAPEPGPKAAAQKPVASAKPDVSGETGQSFFDLQSALTTDASPRQESASVQPGESDSVPEAPSQKDAPAQPKEPDETAKSFFDLQSALAADASLGFDYDPSSGSPPETDKESSFASVLNIVKDIARQDPRQDTPLFHFNLGTAYMESGDYEQAVDEFLSALYGTSDKAGCYVHLAECSLKLQRRELARGFLREALDQSDISPEQYQNARKFLDEISAG